MSMKLFSVAFLVGLVTHALADSPLYGPPAPLHHNHIPVHEHKYPQFPYDFAYGVADHYTGNDFGHTETSDGNAVKGTYHVLLPDGRKQIVTYTADHYNGFQAHVAYEGVAHYPDLPAPAYG